MKVNGKHQKGRQSKMGTQTRKGERDEIQDKLVREDTDVEALLRDNPHKSGGNVEVRGSRCRLCSLTYNEYSCEL
jgi:hypothetical protein